MSRLALSHFTHSVRPSRGERAQSERSEPSTPSTWFEEVLQVAEWTHARIEKVLRAHGRTLDGIGDEPAELTHEQPVLVASHLRAMRCWCLVIWSLHLSPTPHKTHSFPLSMAMERGIPCTS